MRIGFAEAKNKIAALVRIAERGGTIIICRNGRAVAELRPLRLELRELETDPFSDFLTELDTLMKES